MILKILRHDVADALTLLPGLACSSLAVLEMLHVPRMLKGTCHFDTPIQSWERVASFWLYLTIAQWYGAMRLSLGHETLGAKTFNVKPRALHRQLE
jgi:hypothetical protein